MTKSYFYRQNNSVIFRRALGGDAGWANTSTVICDCEHSEQAKYLACRLNLDLETIDQLSQATQESCPGRSSVF